MTKLFAKYTRLTLITQNCQVRSVFESVKNLRQRFTVAHLETRRFPFGRKRKNLLLLK